MARSPRAAALLLLFLLVPGSPLSQDLSAEARARDLLDRGRSKEAVALLKDALSANPAEARILRFLLARAYLADHNDFWALKILSEEAARDPDDPKAPLWMAWVHVQQGALDPAREILETIEVPPGGVLAARASLLKSIVERHAGRSAEASRHLSAARQNPAAFPEDRRAIAHFAALDPGFVPILSGRVDLNGGWVSNALTGSPADPTAADEDASSPAGNASLWVSLAYPESGKPSIVRPVLEAQAKGNGYSRRQARELGHLILGVRPAVLSRTGDWRVLAGYRFEASQVVAGDRYEPGPLWFYEAHRGEAEVEMPGGWMAFGGAGRRLFRESGRSRLETDGGFAKNLALGPRMRLVAALTGRRYLADKDPYHLWGASALATLDLRLPAGWSLRVGLTASQDAYPASTGYFDATRGSLSRRETSGKASVGCYLPSWASGLKSGVVYEYALRESRIDAYDYRDHRVFLRILATFATKPTLPGAETPPGHVEIDYGLEGSLLDERVQDLLRQDESVQRSSSCLD